MQIYAGVIFNHHRQILIHHRSTEFANSRQFRRIDRSSRLNTWGAWRRLAKYHPSLIPKRTTWECLAFLSSFSLGRNPQIRWRHGNLRKKRENIKNIENHVSIQQSSDKTHQKHVSSCRLQSDRMILVKKAAGFQRFFD